MGTVQKAVDLAHLLQLTGEPDQAEAILESAIAVFDQRHAKGATLVRASLHLVFGQQSRIEVG